MLASEGSAGAGHAFGRMILVGFATSKGDAGGSPPSRGRACISVASRFRCRKSFPYRGCFHASSEPVVPSASALGPTKRLVFFRSVSYAGTIRTMSGTVLGPTQRSSLLLRGPSRQLPDRFGRGSTDASLGRFSGCGPSGRPVRRSADRNRENRRCSAVSERRRCTTYRGCQRSICRAVSASSRRRSVRSSGSSANHAAP